MKLPSRVTLCEVGMRDGLQNESRVFSTQQKIDLLNSMFTAGLKVIEVGSFVSPKAVPQMANTDEVFHLVTPPPDVELRALVANIKGVERAIDCKCRKVKLNVSASVRHNQANINKTPSESVAGFRECVNLAAKENVGVSGSISMAFGSPWDVEIPASVVNDIVSAYLDVGVREISLSDASGMANPRQVFELTRTIMEQFPAVNWWLHFHNTRGLGIANIIAGMQAGISQFDTSFAGVGGCPFVPGAAGNVCTEDVVHMLDEMGIETGIILDSVIEIGRRVTTILDHTTEGYILRAGKSKELIIDKHK